MWRYHSGSHAGLYIMCSAIAAVHCDALILLSIWRYDSSSHVDTDLCPCGETAIPRQCPTLSNAVPWLNWMAAYLGYTLQMTTLFYGWPVMVSDTYEKTILKWRLGYHSRFLKWHHMGWLNFVLSVGSWLWIVVRNDKPYNMLSGTLNPAILYCT